ncbi:hypothetical protein O3G_MSEX015239 [Manduca sexta]|uniref:Uncharacterized protein n=1 Tax=Manduca sexta TaxID=7130 RepID=A0A922D165_MANSE|nr:hypothetical protein O3G_MSEX015239 [Manduca sexta]
MVGICVCAVPQADAVVSRGPGARVPAGERAEDGARAARTPLGGGPAQPGRPLLPRVRCVPRRTGLPRIPDHVPDSERRDECRRRVK